MVDTAERAFAHPTDAGSPAGSISALRRARERRAQRVNNAVDDQAQELIAREVGIGLRDIGGERLRQAVFRVRAGPGLGGVGDIPDPGFDVSSQHDGFGLIAHLYCEYVAEGAWFNMLAGVLHRKTTPQYAGFRKKRISRSLSSGARDPLAHPGCAC
jgi:hypothetical protein